MARISISLGLCPVCAATVRRTVHLAAGLQSETYHCGRHGALSYGPRSVPLSDLVAANAPWSASGLTAAVAALAVLGWLAGGAW